MDWQTVAFDWNRARAFLVTAQEGSFSAASRSLGLTQPTVGRQVAALEEELRLTLFERVGARLELTEAGLGLVEHVRAMGEAASRVSLAAAGQSTAVDGLVTLTASQLIAAHLLPPVLGALRARHPGITLDVVADNSIRDLRRREADIAVRNQRPTDDELVARKVRDAVARAYASPAYLESNGDPATAEGLRRAVFFGFGDPEQMIGYLRALGLTLTRDHFPILADDHLVQMEHCRRGLGIAFAMEEVGDADPGLIRVLPELPPLPVPIWVTAHRELRTSRRIRLVFDALVEGLG